MSDSNIKNVIAKLIEELPGTDSDKFFVSSTCLKLLTCEQLRENPVALTAIGELFEACAQLTLLADLEKLPATLSDDIRQAREELVAAGGTDEQTSAILMLAVRLYTEIVSAAKTTEDLYSFSDVVAVAKDEFGFSPALTPAVPYQPGPILFSESQISRVFKTKKLTRDFVAFMARMRCSLIRYSHASGPQVRGFSFAVGENTQFILLETGEVFSVASDSPQMASAISILTNKKDYTTVSATLLCLLFAAADQLHESGIIDADAHHIIKSGIFGFPTVPHKNCAPDELRQAITEYMMTGESNAPDPVFSADIGFDVDGTINLKFVSSNESAAIFSFITQSSDTKQSVIFRNDIPRQICAFGVYLFPLKDILVSMCLVPHE